MIQLTDLPDPSNQTPTHKHTVEAIQRAHFKIVVLDESHSIKNSKSQRFQLLAPILKGATRLVMLSGTPALARPVELYTQVRTYIDTSRAFWVVVD